MLDDRNVLKQRDPSGALDHAERIAKNCKWEPKIDNDEFEQRTITGVIFAGMGGSALASDIAAHILAPEVAIPFGVVRDYDLPASAGENTLVIVDSHSGNTEETLECYSQARQRNCQIGVMATGGKLLELAKADGVAYVTIPSGGQPRMAIPLHLKGLFELMHHFGVIDDHYNKEVSDTTEWLEEASSSWHHDTPTEHNYAKQFALQTVGKTPVFYGGPLTSPLAYKLKISWNENAKNVAFWNQYPEFNHNEFIGWSSHPVDKPFVIVDLISDLERPRIAERMRLSDRLLSGMRPKAIELHIQGETPIQQALWLCVFADFSSIYTAILNHVDPEPVKLVEQLKKELS
ncbi:hypothetical protein EOL96_06580 [Candidatus Saccharibacteria bacterium]|nr:hypothetical protein [Candidatus Saccharibacteria bacterium]